MTSATPTAGNRARPGLWRPLADSMQPKGCRLSKTDHSLVQRVFQRSVTKNTPPITTLSTPARPDGRWRCKGGVERGTEFRELEKKGELENLSLQKQPVLIGHCRFLKTVIVHPNGKRDFRFKYHIGRVVVSPTVTLCQSGVTTRGPRLWRGPEWCWRRGARPGRAAAPPPPRGTPRSPGRP